MTKLNSLLALVVSAAVFPALLSSCSNETADAPETDAAAEETVAEETATEETVAASGETGELTIRANGEDFVRQGFVSKDGWQINFNHLYVTLDEVTAYQSDPAFDAEKGGMPEAETTVSIDETVTVDLAEGDETAEPIVVETLKAPAGRYNALSWKMVPASDGPAAGQTLWIEGTAEKEGETVDFVLKMDPTLGFVCGDFVGDERKGILDPAGEAGLEATFHFDHLFGDGEAAPDDDINTGALGFEPLAAIAEGGTLEADMATLESQLSEADYEMLMGILPSLGHVGEGHCEETELTSS